MQIYNLTFFYKDATMAPRQYRRQCLPRGQVANINCDLAQINDADFIEMVLQRLRESIFFNNPARSSWYEECLASATDKLCGSLLATFFARAKAHLAAQETLELPGKQRGIAVSRHMDEFIARRDESVQLVINRCIASSPPFTAELQKEMLGNCR